MVGFSSNERVDNELHVLVNRQKTYFDKELHVLPYVRSLEFKHKFKTIQITVCPHCGREYRLTHFCDIRGDQIWVSKWKTILHPLYKEFIGKPYNQKGKEEQYRKNPSFILDEERERNPNALVIQPITQRKTIEKLRKDKKPHTLGGLCLCIFFIASGFMVLLRMFNGGFNLF